MTTQLIINVDSKLKNKAMRKAKSQGIPVSAVLRFAMQAFVEGNLNIGIAEEFNARTSRRIARALKDISEGKNISPAFSSADEMVAHLRK